jgi:hypothetical protein
VIHDTRDRPPLIRRPQVSYVGDMPDWNLVTSAHVRTALEECDRLGSRDFVSRYGFRNAHAYRLWHRGAEYDATAVLGVAYLHATGRPATWEDFPDGQDGAAKQLTDLGFDVVVEEQGLTTSRPRAAAAPAKKAAAPAKKAAAPAKRAAAKPERVFTICPRCQMALPSTGICDNCD